MRLPKHLNDHIKMRIWGKQKLIITIKNSKEILVHLVIVDISAHELASYT